MRSGGLLRKAVAIGRMTAEDAAELAMVFAQVARRQARDVVRATTSQLAHARRQPDAARPRTGEDEPPPSRTR